MSIFLPCEGDKYLVHHLTENGDGTGEDNAIGDYSLAEEVFFMTPPTEYSYFIKTMTVQVQDSPNMRAEYYGDLGAALTNGIVVRLSSNGNVTQTLSDNLKIKKNADWAAHCSNTQLLTWGAGDEMLIAEWDFERNGIPIHLNGASNDKLEIVMNDDFSGLVKHHFFCQGFKRLR
jgi:hypothetical protein